MRNIHPPTSPEFLEASCRAHSDTLLGPLGIPVTPADIEKEYTRMMDGEYSVCSGLTDDTAKFAAIAERWPDLYVALARTTD
jgi:hypothetical protein